MQSSFAQSEFLIYDGDTNGGSFPVSLARISVPVDHRNLRQFNSKYDTEEPSSSFSQTPHPREQQLQVVAAATAGAMRSLPTNAHVGLAQQAIHV